MIKKNFTHILALFFAIAIVGASPCSVWAEREAQNGVSGSESDILEDQPENTTAFVNMVTVFNTLTPEEQQAALAILSARNVAKDNKESTSTDY